MIEARKKLEESVKFKLIVDNLDEDIEITSNKNNRVFSSVDKNESKLVNQLNRAKTLSEINNIKVNIFDFKNVEEKLKESESKKLNKKDKIIHVVSETRKKSNTINKNKYFKFSFDKNDKQ